MERITVNMSPTAMLETCHASQFDVGVQKRFDLVDGSSAYTLTGAETITLKIRTPDGTLVESNVPNTSDSYVIWTSGEGELDAFGICLCSIHVTNGSDELGSGNFIMEVEADPYDGKNVRTVTVGPADICTFETTLPEPLQSVIVDIEATGGNGTPDSPIPINGYTEANITRSGGNLYSDIFSEYRKPVNYYIKNIPLKVGTTYTLKAELKSGGTPQTNVAFGVANKGEQYSEFDSRIMCITIGGTTSTYTFAPTSAWTSPKLICYVSGETEFEDVFDNYEIILVEGSSATYHPYTGNTYTISFGQTVYGGVLDVTRGKLSVTHTYIKGGFEQYNASNGYKAYKKHDNPISKSISIGGLSNMINEFGGFNSDSMTKNIIQLPDNFGSCYIALDENYNANDVEIAYELATPFDIDLTPEVISAVVGTNNVFADCGETTVEYLDEG